MGLTDIADGLVARVEALGDGVNEALFEPVIRLGVTGLSRAGKTVFITSLVANLLDRGRMVQFMPQAEGRILSAFLQPQPDPTVPRFDFEAHLAAMTGDAPRWPEGTRAVSELRLSFRIQPGGILSGLRSPRTVHLDIVDYPGEWLLDLSLMDKSFAQWSAEVRERIALRPEAGEVLALLDRTDPQAAFDEATGKALAEHYTAYLQAARRAGHMDGTPGRFLLPGEMAGSPALTFAPLPEGAGHAPRASLAREFERRFEAYKSKVIKPFFRDHFARIDRQVVLVDLLEAISQGPRALEDTRRAMAAILDAFNPGQNALLKRLFGIRHVEKILFAATKADHLHHSQHAALAAILEAMLREARDRAQFAGAETAAMAIASMRATTEEVVEHQGRKLEVVRGTLAETGKSTALYPGRLPADPARLLSPARDGAERWLEADYRVMQFAPSGAAVRPGEGPPHIRLDRVADFLIGDRL